MLMPIAETEDGIDEAGTEAAAAAGSNAKYWLRSLRRSFPNLSSSIDSYPISSVRTRSGKPGGGLASELTAHLLAQGRGRRRVTQPLVRLGALQLVT